MAVDPSDSPRLVRCQEGGYLALSPIGSQLRIGVVADSKEAALAAYATSERAWLDCLSNHNPQGILASRG